MKRFVLTIAALLVLGTFASAAEWLTDYSQALTQAREQKKPVLIDFTGSDWCSWCMRLDREVFATTEFKSYADRNLVLLRVDFPRRSPQPAALRARNEKLAAQFGVNSFPTVVVLKPSGSKAGELGYEAGGPRRFIGSVEKLTGAK
jgi:thioredoxin-related protein